MVLFIAHYYFQVWILKMEPLSKVQTEAGMKKEGDHDSTAI